MAHVGEKFAFGEIGGFRSVFGALQGLLLLFEFGAINKGDDRTHDLISAHEWVSPNLCGKEHTVGAAHGIVSVVVMLTTRRGLQQFAL